MSHLAVFNCTFSILSWRPSHFSCFFFFNDTATTEIYTLSLHDALPILLAGAVPELQSDVPLSRGKLRAGGGRSGDRKSTRLNSSHVEISYAVFCLKKKKKMHFVKYTRYKPHQTRYHGTRSLILVDYRPE